MDLRILIFLSLIGLCITAQVGSGDEETTFITDDEEGSDIYLAGEGSGVEAGDDEDDDDEIDINSSGQEPPIKESTTTTLPANVRCDSMSQTCWCVYTDGTEVPLTKGLGLPSTCSQYKDKPTTAKLIPLRTKPTDAPIEARELTDEMVTDGDNDIEIDYNSISTIKPGVKLEVKSTSTVKPTQRYNNNIIPIDNGPPKVSNNIDEDTEELTNEISGTRRQVDNEAVRTEPLQGALSFSHPGIMAAVIGGAVVGLLCAILLVMFIIYRMRKKDEGSYPLDDSKPLKNYAYAKAPSKEFFA